FDRMDPDGKVWEGSKTFEAVIDRLREAEAKLSDPDEPLSGWQLDPIYMNNERVTRHDLDKVSTTRPVAVLHASGHIMNVNTKALEISGLLKQGLNHPGIPLGDDGLPMGELKSPEVMTPVGPHVGFDRAMTDCDEPGLRAFAKLCVSDVSTCGTNLRIS
ncbi:MAG: amidohydrolase family protein, partial [Paracoccaceae bacterium]